MYEITCSDDVELRMNPGFGNETSWDYLRVVDKIDLIGQVQDMSEPRAYRDQDFQTSRPVRVRTNPMSGRDPVKPKCTTHCNRYKGTVQTPF